MLSGGGDARRAATAVVCRFLVLGTLLPWAVAPSAAASAGAAHGGSLATVPVSAMPEGLADDARTGRVFVVTMHYAPPYDGAVIVLDAHSGKVLRSTPLSVAAAHSGSASGRRLPVSPGCPGCIAVDERSGRVFVLSPGLAGDRLGPTHPPAQMFMFDAASGRLLATTSLVVRPANENFSPAVVVDAGTNRVFSANDTARMSVLDATTGKLLHTVVFPNHQGPDASPAVPLGVDSRDGWVIVRAPDRLVAVDERTGKPLRSFRLPDGQEVVEGLVDGRRGRAVLALSSADETIDLRSGKVVGPVYGGSTRDDHPLTQPDHLLAIDQRSGRVVDVNANTIPPATFVVDDTTGAAIPGMAPAGGDTNSPPAGAINPITGHALVVSTASRFVGPTFLQAEDLGTGGQLAVLPVAGAPSYVGPSIAVDVPTRHAFVANPSLNSVTMLDATKL